MPQPSLADLERTLQTLECAYDAATAQLMAVDVEIARILRVTTAVYNRYQEDYA